MPHWRELWPCFMIKNEICSGKRRFPLRIWLCLVLLLCCMAGLSTTASANTGTCPQCLGKLATKSCGSYVCQQCGETVVDNHQYQEIVVEAASCTTPGVSTFTCMCGDSYTEETPPTGHAYTATGTANACQTCNLCGMIVSAHEPENRDANGKCQQYCTICKYVFYNTNHTIETIVTEPTCVESGLSIEVCKFCSKEFNRKILEATGKHIKEIQIAAPTCAESGLERDVCKVCNAEFSRKVLPKTNNHTLTTTINAATCGQPGLATTWCKICGVETERVETPATGRHTEITETTEATCEKDGVKLVKCEVCNKEIRRTVIPARGRHVAEADDGDPSTPVRCWYCGKTLREGNDTSKNINGMNEFAFKIFKTIRTICIPLAIISFASCGWKFLGSIFFGNYVSMAGTDMMKTQKQLVLTILAVMLVVLFPRIYGAAIALFQEGFENGDGTIFKPWTPIDP